MTDPMTEAAGGQVAAGEAEKIALAACPCCNGEAYAQEEHWRDGTLCGGHPFCRECGLSMPRYWPGRKAEPIAAWNTRPTPSRDALVEALRKIAEGHPQTLYDGTIANVPHRGHHAQNIARQALAATIPADDGAGEAVKLAFTWAYARGFQVADETSRSCIGSIDDAWQDYLAALRPTGEVKP